MSKIVLYENSDLTGEEKEFMKNVDDLSVFSFANTASSIRVIGQHWVVYICNNFQGEFKVLGPGDHGNLGELDKKINSLRLVNEDLKNPDIVLYEHIDYGGQSRSILEKTNDLKKAGFGNLVSSHKVKQGVWILYQDINLTGSRLITFRGNEWSDYRDFGWNDKLNSVRPLLNSDFEL